ncbi:MAG: aminopeptidase N [Planctomycetota bacterium]|nr:aminopeptidase N [Planctomycetota bacterium]MDA1112994.1 aminopeptidase N [Planctomycetota bacterium]
MKTASPVEKFRKDYCPTDFEISAVTLDFKLGKDSTLVTSRLEIKRRESGGREPLVLDGEDLELLSLKLDGEVLDASQYSYEGDQLRLAVVPDSFTLQSEVRLRPQNNTQLSGLYSSGKMFCTQCEAEGFRRITFFLDRPDVMSAFKVRIEGSQEDFPILLSNGNCIASGEVDNGMHYTVWEDPFVKPSYLFALVAGDLGSISDTFTTQSGREVALHVYTEHENVKQLDFAMESLKKSMTWDQEVFGLEYDLDIFNIVAVGDFNMGAMENKSLNVFNTAYVLAQPETATDGDYEGIERVIGHEYFHNWTGNRVTCRDWFQLTLKEGLTVFRDQQFSADMGSAAVKRIEDVQGLRAIQFREDSGPMAHPIRPESYIAMDNFYTSTVYSKGAEIIRMMHTLVGVEGFRKGMDLYFERHDGQAVSCDDFRAAMADANQIDLTQFENWYLQAGTPVVEASGSFSQANARYTLTLRQSCPSTPGQAVKQPFHIPVSVGLLSQDGKELAATQVLDLKQAQQEFHFDNIEEAPIPSILRGFSAPVRLVMDQSDEELAILLAHDRDSFNRWDAGQRLGTRVLLHMVAEIQAGNTPEVPQHLIDALQSVLTDLELDPALKAYALRLPDSSTLGAELEVIDPDALYQARKHCVQGIALALRESFESLYRSLEDHGPYSFDLRSVGRRQLRNLCLGYLSSLEDQAGLDLAASQFEAANNMTERMAAFVCQVNHDATRREASLQTFLDRYRQEALVVDKWFAVQASSSHPDTLQHVKALLNHEAFDIKNPNKVRSLVRTFAGNQLRFHGANGEGYRFIADMVIQLDALNPQMAARIAGAFSQWRRFDDARQALMKTEMERIAASEALSKDTGEIIARSLQG